MKEEKIEQLELRIAQEIIGEKSYLTDGDTGYIYRKNHGVYEKLSDNQIYDSIITEFIDNDIKYTRARRNVTYDFLKTSTYMSSKHITESTKNSVNLLNGVYFFDKTFEQLHVNNDTGESWTTQEHFQDHLNVKNYYSFNQIPVKYDKNATCPTIDKFITDVFGLENCAEIYEFIGYILLPHVRYQRAIMMVGSGKNGKTTFLDMLVHFLGLENICAISLQDLDGRFALINLKNKMANIVGDLSSKPLEDTGNAKRIVTDQILSGNIKNVQGIFNFENRCKMLYSVNELPRTKDKSTAFYRRWIMKICDNVFEGENKDPHIYDKLTTEEEMSGLLNRALEGIERLRENNGFENTELEVKSLWELETNPIGDFILNRCNIEDGKEIRSKELFEAVNQYRKEKHVPLLNGKSIGYWLRQYGIVGKRRRVDDNTYTFYQEIELKEEYIEEINVEAMEGWLE
ncbi:MAG: hypothetical protein GY853_00655 [PVC group bacterium]|nr:hypothetical protein [PVC group bacterium]